MKKSLEFIDELILIEKLRDAEWIREQKENNPDFKTVGEGAMVFHLKALKELVQSEYSDIVSLKRDT
jgi:hypothetical protein